MIEKYGDDIVNATKDFAKSDAKEVIELINTYGDDALKMVKSKQSGNLVKEVCEGLKENNISYDDFQILKRKNSADFSSDEIKVMRNIRNRSKINQSTRMKKIITDKDVQKYYINGVEGENNTVGGCISRAKDSKCLSHNYKDVVETYRLDYLKNGKRPFPDEGNCHWEMEFNIANESDMSQIEVPYGEKFGGDEIDPEPFKGNGYTGGRNETTIPEWKIKDRIQIKENSILSKYVDGKCVEKYRFDGEEWIKIAYK